MNVAVDNYRIKMLFSETINDTNFDEWNALLAGGVSLIGNMSLIYFTFNIKMYTDSVRRMQIFGCILRLIFSLSVVLCSPTLAYIMEAEAVYIVKGGFTLPIPLGQFVLIVFITFVLFSCMGPPSQFLQAYLIIKKSQKGPSNVVFVTTLISFLLSILASCLIFLGYMPTDDDDQLSEEIVYYLNGRGKAAYLIASLERYDYTIDQFVPDPISWVSTLYILAILVFSTIIVVICYFLIEYHRSKDTTMSANLWKSQKQLNTILVIQFALPFITIHIPFYISFLVPLFQIETTHFSIYLPYLFSWCPALNPIIVMLLIKSIRDRIFPKNTVSNSHSSCNFIVRPKNGTSAGTRK